MYKLAGYVTGALVRRISTCIYFCLRLGHYKFIGPRPLVGERSPLDPLVDLKMT